MPFTDLEIKIAKQLVSGEKSLQELVYSTGLQVQEINEGLKSLIKKGLIEKRAEKYALLGEIIDRLQGKPKFRAMMMIENASQSKESLIKAVEDFEKRLRKEPYVYENFFKSDITEYNGIYSQYFSFVLGTQRFEDMVNFVINYGPGAIEFLEPDSFTVNLRDAQMILLNVSSAVNYYISLIASLYLQKLRAEESENVEK
ncbi:MAG: hypothetical protein QW097_00635 [archaeon]